MSDTRASHELSLERLRSLAEAYGGSPERWPDAERAAAERLVASSPAAAAVVRAAAELDRLLGHAVVEPPSLGLATRVLAAAPRRRRAPNLRRILFMAAPLAAAAGVALWLTAAPEAPRRLAEIPLGVGEYTSATDVLLEPWGGDAYATLPSVGCADSTLGCPRLDAPAPDARQSSLGRLHA
jgi:hypothetical protein